MRLPCQQGNAEFLLQKPNTFGQRGLGNIQIAPRLAQAASIRNRGQMSKLSEFHVDN
jgi:hypothetical protein